MIYSKRDIAVNEINDLISDYSTYDLLSAKLKELSDLMQANDVALHNAIYVENRLAAISVFEQPRIKYDNMNTHIHHNLVN